MATSSSFIASKLKSPNSSTSPSTNGYLNSPISSPPRVPPPPPTQKSELIEIILTPSPITLLKIQFNTPLPPPPIFGHLIPWNLLEAHGDSCLNGNYANENNLAKSDSQGSLIDEPSLIEAVKKVNIVIWDRSQVEVYMADQLPLPRYGLDAPPDLVSLACLPTRVSNNKKDKTAIAFLYQALPEEQLLQITKHKTVKAIWDSLRTRHIGEERVQQARLQTLKSDFEMLHMKEDETIDTFTAKLTTLVNKAASLGHTMEDETLVRKLLNVVPDRYLQIVASIEQYLDLSEMTLEEAIGRLETYEERIKGRGRGKHIFSQGRNRENFKEEWKDGETSHKSYNRNNFKKSSYDTSKLLCLKCKEYGHFANKYPSKKEEQSNLIEEDLEPTLLMATIAEEQGNSIQLQIDSIKH
ncbi:zinc finger, CCHC-type containing protein [Tanacetum coccineum]